MTPPTPHDPRCAIVRNGNTWNRCDCQIAHLYEALEDVMTWVDYFKPLELLDHPEWEQTEERAKKALRWHKSL